MSIADRLDDSQLLASHGRQDGALLSLLVAVAATSRRRYPLSVVKSDRHAFIRFLLDETPLLVPCMTWMPSDERDYNIAITAKAASEAAEEGKKGLWVKVHGADLEGWPESQMPLATALYRYLRNSLVHEGTMPAEVRVSKDDGRFVSYGVHATHVDVSATLFEQIRVAVMFAPENADQFPAITEAPDDVIAWHLFKHARERRGSYLKRRAERRAALQSEQVQPIRWKDSASCEPKDSGTNPPSATGDVSSAG